MCPDRQIISLYLDGELPSPWKGKMEAHLKSCSECRAVLAGYKRLGENLHDLPDETILAARDRTWQKLEYDQPKVIQAPKKIWKGTITLPIPAAAAAAVLIIVMFLAVLGIKGKPQPMSQIPMAAANIGLDDQGMVPVTDMSGVLQYLSSQDNGDYMVIRLPETRKFSHTGEPALINAADYSRRIISR